MPGLALRWQGCRNAVGLDSSDALFETILHAEGERVESTGEANWWLGCSRLARLYSTAGLLKYSWAVVAIDGYISNRADILARLDLPGTPGDCELIAALYRENGIEGIAVLAGSFAIIIIDKLKDKVVLFRDHLNQRSLFYACSSGKLFASTRSQFILAQNVIEKSLDDHYLANLFAGEPGCSEATAFSAVKAVRAGECVVVDGRGIVRTRFPFPYATAKIVHRSALEYADDLLVRLDRAAGRCVGERDPVAIMLSSGLDSTFVAACASKVLAQAGRRLGACSWGFPSCTTADETSNIRDVANYLGMSCAFVDMRAIDLSDWPVIVDTPLSNPFRTLKLALYECASASGVSVILNAEFADMLYGEPSDWLLGTLRWGGYRLAFAELVHQFVRIGPLGLYRDSGVRRSLRWLRPRPHLVRGKAWLTSFAMECIGQNNRECIPEAEGHHSPERARSILATDMGAGVGYESAYTGPFGLERRDPFRDHEVVEFFLGTPPVLLQRPGFGRSKPLARLALQGRIPEAVRQQGRVGTLGEFLIRSLIAQLPQIRHVLLADDCLWPRYVKRDWVLARLNPEGVRQYPIELWRCFAFELWRRRVEVL